MCSFFISVCKSQFYLSSEYSQNNLVTLLPQSIISFYFTGKCEGTLILHMRGTHTPCIAGLSTWYLLGGFMLAYLLSEWPQTHCALLWLGLGITIPILPFLPHRNNNSAFLIRLLIYARHLDQDLVHIRVTEVLDTLAIIHYSFSPSI